MPQNLRAFSSKMGPIFWQCDFSFGFSLTVAWLFPGLKILDAPTRGLLHTCSFLSRKGLLQNHARQQEGQLGCSQVQLTWYRTEDLRYLGKGSSTQNHTAPSTATARTVIGYFVVFFIINTYKSSQSGYKPLIPALRRFLKKCCQYSYCFLRFLLLTAPVICTVPRTLSPCSVQSYHSCQSGVVTPQMIDLITHFQRRKTVTETLVTLYGLM